MSEKFHQDCSSMPNNISYKLISTISSLSKLCADY